MEVALLLVPQIVAVDLRICVAVCQQGGSQYASARIIAI